MLPMPFKILLLAIAFAIPISPSLWSIMDIPKRKFPSPKQKYLWLAIVASLPCIGGVIYILFERRKTEPAA
ncbi:MAG: PLDc N-terminal domain-containing protein [Syntrophobacteraceae bacterium]